MVRFFRIRIRVLLPAILGATLLLAACHRKPAQPASGTSLPPGAVSVNAPPIPVPDTWPELPLPPSRLPTPPEPPIPKSFRDGQTNFQSGRYAEAVRLYEKYIREDPTTQYKDEALFKLGMAHALLCSASECRTRAVAQFKRLVSLFPKSPYSAEAQFILSLQNDIEKTKADAKAREEKINRLTDELERLKKIDLERQTSRTKK
jgi:tetratricopeptide (TPR) repeat protein